MEKQIYTRGQMSEAVSTGILLTMSGGFQDAYTYYCRGKVFANAQTGNIVLMGSYLASGQWAMAMRYFGPVAAFAGGVYMSEHIRRLHQRDEKLHWRQMVANIMVSFVCAMQVDAFRKIKGSPYASTMCIGNLRSATEQLYRFRHTKDRECLGRCMRYYGVILMFAVGAVMGSVTTSLLGERTIWLSCVLLLASFIIMFVREDIEKKEGF